MGAVNIIRNLRINRKWIITSTKTRPRNQLSTDNLLNVIIANKTSNETTSTTRIAIPNTRSVK